MRILLFPFLLIASSLFAQVQPPPPAPQQATEVTVEPDPDAVPEAASDAPQETLTVVEQMPELPGGQQAMMTYLVKHMRYPQDCIENEIEGKVFIGFVVDTAGMITDVDVLRGVRDCPAMDKEAARVVKSMPNWTPGRQNGKPVRVRMTVPVMFKLN